MTATWALTVSFVVSLLLATCLFCDHAAAAAKLQSQEIEVFVIPHTHDDVGWLLTVDQYYTQQVEFILDSCIQNLVDNPARKFTYVETGYFERWWHQISDAKQQQVRQLVANGQLEFNVGGITMNDEATTTFFEEINQMTTGALFLQDNVGAKPLSVWHIDPFGHSAVTASLWAQSGFSGFVLNRIPADLKAYKIAHKELEFVWRPSKSLGSQTDIWIHVLDSHYSSPEECAFNNNDGWNGIYIQDDPTLFGLNIEGIANNFINMVYTRSSWYVHNLLLIPFGDDFAHREAYNSFVNMDKLINYVNANQTAGVKVRYAHLSDYVNAVNNLNLTWPVFTGDFFPYADSFEAFWSGYYTSRPLLKEYVRSSDSLLAAAEQLAVLSRDQNPSVNRTALDLSLTVMRQATSIATHHDAVTGTEKQAVAVDYTTRLDMGTVALQSILPAMVSALLPDAEVPPVTFVPPDRHAVPRPLVHSTGTSTYAVYNQLGWARQDVASILVSSPNVVVTDGQGNTVPSQVNPVPSFDTESAPYRVYFVVNLPPLGFEVFTVSTGATGAPGAAFIAEPRPAPGGDVVIANEYATATVDGVNGRLKALSSFWLNNESIAVVQDFFQYSPSRDSSGQASGAYIFRPWTNSVADISQDNNAGARQVTTIELPDGYTATPLFVGTLAAQDYNDCFTFSVRSESSTQISLNTYRVDNNGGTWAQDLQLDYVAWTPADIPSGFQTGSAAVSPSSTSPLQTVSVTFPTAFSAAPVVIATVASTDSVDDVFAVSTRQVTSTGFQANVYRTDGSGWSLRDLHINWIATLATPAGAQPPSDPFLAAEAIYAGTTTVGASENAQFVSATFNHTQSSANPIILLTPRGANVDDTFTIMTRGSRTPTSFSVNVYLVNGKSWSQTLQLDWVILPRHALLYPVSPAPVDVKVLNGPIVNEIQQVWRQNYAQTVRLYSGLSDGYRGSAVEITSHVGPLDQGAELVTRFDTELVNNNYTIYTDDNGLEMQQRVFNYTPSELIAGNYYPVVSRAYMLDSQRDIQFTLLSDSSHGGASLSAGSIELMLHRRCLDDDGRGVGEVLNETVVISPSLWAVLADPEVSARLHRRLSLLQNFPLLVVPVPSTGHTVFSGLASPLPDQVHLLSLRAYDAASNTSILRLQHVFEVGENPVLSQPVKVDLGGLFSQRYKISVNSEMNLLANQPYPLNRLHWNTETSADSSERYPLRDNIVTLNPMEIHTFSIDFS